jgi:hypothetical protein
MTIRTTTQQLEAVQTAIQKAESTQSYTIGDASVTRAKLKDLYAREEQLIARLAKENNSSPTVSQAYFGNAGD